MARSRSKPTVPCNQGGSEGLGKHDIRRIIGRKVLPQVPDSRQEWDVNISANPKIQQISECLVGSVSRDHSLQCQSAQYLGYFEIQQVGRVQCLVTRKQPVLDAFTHRGLEEPVNRGRCVQYDHRLSRSSRIN